MIDALIRWSLHNKLIVLTLAAILLPFTAHLSPEHKADAVAKLCDSEEHDNAPSVKAVAGH